MTLILSGTDGLSDIDGSAATPAIRGTDTNTGIFFPAADTIAFSEGGVEAMRIDSSGNVGIGTSSPVGKVESKTATVAGSSADYAQKAFVANITYSTTNVISSLLSGWDGSAIHGVDVGYTYNGTGYNLIFSTNDNTSGNPIERARIDSSGNLLVGTTSQTIPGVASRFLVSYATADYAAGIRNTNAIPYGLIVNYSTAPNGTGNEYILCNDNSTARMIVRSNGGIANFSANNVNLSDRREKINFAPAKSYLDTICAIPVQTFNYIDQNMEEDPGKTLGVVAQDVQAVAPELVMESNWGTKDDPKMRLSIYQTDLQYALMKCIQEQQAIIQSLTARIEALEGK